MQTIFIGGKYRKPKTLLRTLLSLGAKETEAKVKETGEDTA